MKARLIVVAVLLATGTLVAQNFKNANVVNADARNSVARAIGTSSGWYAWNVPLPASVNICCGSCTLGSDHGWSINNDRDSLGGGGMMTLAVRVDAGSITKVQMFGSNCAIDGRGNEVHWLQNVDPASSIAFLESQASKKEAIGALAQHDHPNTVPALERLAGRGQPQHVREQAIFWLGVRGGDEGFRYLRNVLHGDESSSIRKKAVFAITQSESDDALPELINLARRDESHEIRREAIFWLGQKAGEKAAAEIRRAVDEDPDEDVREHAVFAISQLPRERSIPMLIDLAKNHKSPGVRKKAMFWLAQTGDDRALEVIEEILTK